MIKNKEECQECHLLKLFAGFLIFVFLITFVLPIFTMYRARSVIVEKLGYENLNNKQIHILTRLIAGTNLCGKRDLLLTKEEIYSYNENKKEYEQLLDKIKEKKKTVNDM